MSLASFNELWQDADARSEAVTIAVAGANDATVLQALRAAFDRGWIKPILVGPEKMIRESSEACGVELSGFAIVAAEDDDVPAAAVAEVREGRAALLMKGRISTPTLLSGVLDPGSGLRTDRTVCQVVLMEVQPTARRFLLADPGICVRPKLDTKLNILHATVEVGHALGVERPRVALMAATETVNIAMPETIDAAEIQRRNQAGEFPDCLIQGPLSFDLAYTADAADKKRIGGPVVGVADAMVFANLLSANLTVKAIMYTADCRFGGVLRGTSAPVVFMSRADTAATRLNSLALALRLRSFAARS